VSAPRRQAPPLQASQWLNARAPIVLEQLHGRAVAVHAFQMLCPGCVSQALPQAQRMQALFPPDQLQVIGLHSVFEHHEAMTPAALAAFVHEYRLDFPIAIDAHADGDPIPLTMRAYGLQGTPSLVLIDRSGAIRLQHFGRIDDMRLGAAVARLLTEGDSDPRPTVSVPEACNASGCPLPGRAIDDAPGTTPR
jgi:hypothetical protein